MTLTEDEFYFYLAFYEPSIPANRVKAAWLSFDRTQRSAR